MLQIRPEDIQLPSMVRGRPASRTLSMSGDVPMAALDKVQQLEGHQAAQQARRARALARWVELKIKHQSTYLNASSEGEW
jgi:hypothetical protein